MAQTKQTQTPTAVTLGALDRTIRGLETRFRMTSDDFLRRWHADELDDSDHDLNRWAMFLSLRAKAGREAA